MDIADWRGRWTEGRIGFHEGKTNSLLADHLDLLAHKRRVLVPLCGKSVDLATLALSHEVVGVEGVARACEEFFREQQIPMTRDGDRFRGEHVELVCGDFFAQTRDAIGTFDAAYDRAALIAVDRDQRERYVDTLCALLAPKARVLLVAFSYDQSKTDGPPWSLDASDVRALFLPRGFVVEPLAVASVSINPRLQAAGVTWMREELFLLTRLC